jgi:hypothetical protein
MMRSSRVVPGSTPGERASRIGLRDHKSTTTRDLILSFWTWMGWSDPLTVVVRVSKTITLALSGFHHQLGLRGPNGNPAPGTSRRLSAAKGPEHLHLTATVRAREDGVPHEQRHADADDDEQQQRRLMLPSWHKTEFQRQRDQCRHHEGECKGAHDERSPPPAQSAPGEQVWIGRSWRRHAVRGGHR